jgi:hypothetical protein
MCDLSSARSARKREKKRAKWRAELGGGVRKSINRKKEVARCCASKIKYVCAAFNDVG